MADTGALAPTAATTTAESPWSDDGWTNVANIYGAGEASVTAATFDAGDQTEVLKAYTFNTASIPDGSTINGVVVVINARYATAPASIDLCQLLDVSRAKVGTNLAATPTALTTSAADYTFGGSTNTWGNSLTAAWVKDADFGVAIGCLAGGSGNNNVDVYIDSVTLRVYYTAPINLTVNDASATTQSDTFKLTKNSNVVTQDASATTQADTFSLVKNSSLIVADASATTQADAVTVSKVFTLSVADASATSQADAVVITRNITLTVADAFSTSGADNVALTLTALRARVTWIEFVLPKAPGVTLTVTHDNYSTTQADSVTLTISTTLTVADGASTSQADALVVTKNSDLITADASATTQADNVTLTQVHSFLPGHRPPGYRGVSRIT